MNDLISIIIPVYNVEDFVEECLNSVINQTYTNLEIIIVNDGSTDGSLDICKKFTKDNRVKLITQQNRGLSGARNTGIENANGKYIGFVDSDDFIDIKMYEKLHEAIVRYDADIATCGRYIYRDDIIVKKAFNCNRSKVFSKSEAMKDMLLSKCIDMAAWDKLYTRQLFDKIRYPEGENNEDLAIIYKLIDRCERVVHSGYSGYYYRVRVGSISKSGFSLAGSKLQDKHFLEMYEYCVKNFDDINKYLDIFYVDTNFPLLLSGIKSGSLTEEEKKEVNRRKYIHKKNFSLFISNSNHTYNSFKNRIIGLMIYLDIYKAYLYLKNKITRR